MLIEASRRLWVRSGRKEPLDEIDLKEATENNDDTLSKRPVHDQRVVRFD